MTLSYDLFVIGAGSGGVACARSAAALGAKVGIAEYAELGGTCVNRGCVPKKYYVYASHYAEEFKNAMDYGWQAPSPTFDWHTLKENVFNQVSYLNGVYQRLLEKHDVTIHQGKAMFLNEKTVQVGDDIITADKFMIATGGHPHVIPIEGHEFGITSDEAFHLEELPKSIAIIGAGYIAVEFACIFHGLGVDAHQFIRKDKLLRGFDEELREQVGEAISQKGIHLHFQTNIEKIEKTDNGLLVHTDTGKHYTVDQVLFATGRKPNTEGLGLENANIELDQAGAILVDEWQQTSTKNIYAIGDVTNRINLTPVAINEGRAFSDTHFGKIKRNMNYSNVPSAVFSQPSIATVGLTEEQAKQEYGNIDIYTTRFKPMRNNLGAENHYAFMKIVVDSETDKVLGVHVMSDDAAEIVQGFAVALQCGATKEQFDRTVGIHPSNAEELVTIREKR